MGCWHTTVRATCWACGEVEMPPQAIDLKVCFNRRPLSTYQFVCPACKLLVEKAADERVIAILYSAGVQPTIWRLPAEALESHDGPPLSVDDLLDFHQALESL